MAQAGRMTDTGGMELLEREPSLALLADCAAEARRGDGRLVVLGGEAGVGKTALLERFQRELRDARWSWGACDGLFTPRPLGPLYDLADQLGGDLLDLCARGASRDDLFRALLRHVSGPGPVNVVVVEDIHWADEATIDLLRFAGRRLRDARVLLVVTFRDDDLATDDQLRVALGELARHRTTRRIALAPLSADAVRALADGSSLEAAALYQLTGRNALNTEGASSAVLGREWTGLLDRALRIALDEGLQAEAGRAYCNYYATHCSQRQFAAAEQLYADGIAYCDDHDIATYGTFLRSERTGTLEKTGRWDEALALCQDILDRAAPAPVTRLCPTTRAGTLMARRGEATAWEYLDQAMADADRTGEPQSIVPVRLARAEACWLEGRGADAVHEAERADEAADTDDAWTYGAVAAWLRRTGSSRQPRGDVAEPYRQQLSGHWEKAAQLWTDLDCPYEAALVRLDAADEGALREALSTFTEIGASAVARLTRQRLRALGARSIPAGPRSATRGDPLGLTRREREILAEICAGQTNAAIAAKLFISAKTVDHHVSAVLAKLGAPNRNAAAARAAQLGLLS